MVRTSTHIFLFLLLLGNVWSCSYLPEDLPLMEGLDVEETREYIALSPSGSESLSATGLIFYPGGLVDPHAYMGWAGAFALAGPGHRVIIAKTPVNLAVMKPGLASKIIRNEEIQQWVLGGHSLGGAMACNMALDEPATFEALVLMAAYPAASADLSDWEGQVLSLSGSNDLVVDMENFEGAKERLPAHTLYREIIGGNHAGFGSYGPQEGDGEAGISLEEQHNIILASLEQFFEFHGLD